MKMQTAFPKFYNEKYTYPIGSERIEDSQNIILTQNGRMGYRCLGNDNIMAIGPAEYLEKSIAAPNILQGYGSYIVIDPNGTIYEYTKEFLTDNGYTIKIFDPEHPEESVAYNPFEYICKDDMKKKSEGVLAVMRCIINATATDGKMDLFWEKAEEALLQALMFYVLDHCEPEEQNLVTMAELLKMDMPGKNDALDRLFEKVRSKAPKDMCVKQYEVFKQASPKTAQAILTIARNHICGFANANLRSMIDHDEMHMETWGDIKTAVFLKGSCEDGLNRVLTNMMLTQTFPVLRTQAEKEQQIPLKVPVHFILNAFTSIGEIPNFSFPQCVMHHYGLSCMILVHTIDDLRKCYGDKWEAIAGCCYATVYFKNDTNSEQDGKKDVGSAKEAALSDFEFVSARIGVMKDTSGKLVRLVSSEEVSLIKPGHAICMVAGQEPVEDAPYDLETHPAYCQKKS